MKRAAKPAADPARKQAVIYARVSSKEQEKEGFSIPAQLKLLKEYAAANGFALAQEYIDVETAKQTGFTAFGEMVAYLKAHPSVRVMLVEKTDRLYRNLKDWVTVDELDVEMHIPKEGVVLSRESRSSEKFMHGIKVLMAKNYIDNLSEEARKGMQEKAEQGIWPTKTPLGYRNITGPDGKKIIATETAIAPLIANVFEWYARGDISLKEAARKAHAAGLTYPKSGAKVPVSTVHTILRNRLYTGWFEWNGKLIQGKHDALVPVEIWERVQGVLDGRFASKAKRGKHDFAFSGLIACHACGCAVVGEIKKQRYVYYHCTGYADKCQGNPASCRRKHVREEALEAQFTELLGRLRFDDEVLEWVRDALHASHADERHEHEEAIKRDQAEYKRLQDRINAMYVDKLDGLVETAFYDRMSNQWREEQNRCQREIERHQNADRSYKDEGVALLDLARNAQRLFAEQEPREKRRLLNFVLSNCTWEDGEVVATFRQPFDVLAETASAAARIKAGERAKSSKSEIWLTNVRNTASAHWRRWLDPQSRCLVPFTSFSEHARGRTVGPSPYGSRSTMHARPLGFFAGIWTGWTCTRKVAEGEVACELFAFLTTEPNREVGAVHPKAMPVILAQPQEFETWVEAPWADARRLQRQLPDGALRIVARGEKEDPPPLTLAFA